MQRRSFIGSILASVALLFARPAVARSEKLTVDVVGVLRWKPENIINVEQWHRLYRDKRLYLDGVDVTADTVMALPGDPGWIVRHATGADGRYIWDYCPSGAKRELRRETLCGRVEIRPASGIRIAVRADDRISPALRDISDKIGQLEITVTP